jgi:hypothetical protein
MGSLLDTIKSGFTSLLGGDGATAGKPVATEVKESINVYDDPSKRVPGVNTDISTLPPVTKAGDASTTGESVDADVAKNNTGALGGVVSDTKVKTGTEGGIVTTGGAVNTGAGGKVVARGGATTGTKGAVVPVTTTGGATGGAVTPEIPQAPTGNTYSFEGDAATRGASGDVKSQAMYDLAQEALNRGDMRGAEAILRRPLNNQDFFPGPGLQQSRTAWGDPLFTGAGQLFPMAVMDARQKAMAEAEAMAMREEALNFEIPNIEVAGLRNNYSQTFVSDAEKFVADGIAKYGSRRNAIRELKRSGEWARFMAEHKATADAINYTGKEAQTYLKNAQEGQLKGETYATPESLAAAQAYLLGLNEWNSGQINNTQLNQLAEQFRVWESWDKYEKESRSRIKPTEISIADMLAQQHASNPSPQDIQAYEAVKMELPESSRDMKAWLYNKKISEVLAPQIKAAVIEPFFASNPSAVQQFQSRYPNMEIEDIKNLVAEQYAMGYGRQVETGQITQTTKGGFSINVGGDKSEKTGIYQNIISETGNIKSFINNNIGKLSASQLLRQAYKLGDASESIRDDKDYFGVKIPGIWGLENQTVTPGRFESYYVPDGNNISYMKSYSAKEALAPDFKGDIPQNMAPTSAKIKDVVLAWGVPDPASAGGYRIIKKEDGEKRGIPDNAEQLALEVIELTFDKNEYEKKDPAYKNTRFAQSNKIGEVKVNRTAYRISPATQALGKVYDQQVSTSSGTASPAGKGKNIQVSGSMGGEDFSTLE